MPKFTISRKNTLGLGDICLTSYGLRLNSDTDDKEKFQKKDLVSKKRNKTNSRVYTERKYLEKYCITKELFVEWETERCPNRLVRPTFPQLYEPEKLLMSRQKRIAAYSDSQHICDNTIIVGVLAKDLKKVQNSNIRKYYQNLELPRTEIEENSRRFNLKYILVILNSNLISYFLKHNSGGKIDSYPDDWKKVPIKILPKDKQKNYVKKADMLLDLNSKLSGDVSAFLKQVKAECGLDRTPRILRTFYDVDDAVFMALLAKHKRMSLDEKDGWYRYFEQCKKKALDIKIQIVEIENKVNTMVYKLYGLTDEEIKVVENAIAGNHKQ